MPRPRSKANSGLPKRWRFKNGAYRYQVPKADRARWDGKAEFTLGATLPDAYKVWSDRIGVIADTRTVDQLLDRYSLEVSPKKKPASRRNDSYIIPVLKKHFGHFRIVGDIEPSDVFEYVNKRVDNTGRQVLTAAHREAEVLSHAFTWAVQWGIIKAHPFKKEVRFERELQPKRKERYVEDWEIVEALSLVPMRKRGSVRMCQAYIRLKLLTGLRQTDLLRLRVIDARTDGIHVQASKTESTTGAKQIFAWVDKEGRDTGRRAAWDGALAARPLDIAHFVFCNDEGDGYLDEETGRSNGFSSIWQRFMRRVLKETKLEKKFSERHLRSKVGSDAESLERARKILGHADVRTTKQFYRLKAEVIE